MFRKNFSDLWVSGFRFAFAKTSSVCILKPIQFALLKLMKVLLGAFMVLALTERVNLIGRWSELIAGSTFQLQFGIRSLEAIVRSGEVLELPSCLVGTSSFNVPYSESFSQVAMSCPR